MRTAHALARTALIGLPVLLLLGGCDPDDPGDPIDRDFAEIQERDTLTALVTYNSTGYFVYRGEPMGFEYRLLLAFAEDHDLVLKARVVRDRSQLYHLLNEGAGDVVAARVVAARSDTADVAYTRGLYETRPSLAQRTGRADLPEAIDTVLENPPAGAPEDPMKIRARLVTNPSELKGEDIYVPGATFYEDRLIELADSLGDDITVVEVDSASYELLLRRLSLGEIGFVVTPENVGELKESYYTNIVVRPALGPEEPVVWAVRRNADALLRELNSWIQAEQALIRQAYDRYFVDRRGFNERVASEYLTSETGRLSEYDDLFRAEAPAIGWDWRLLASQAFQESKFDPNARSWAGAMGILQLMPATAREVNVSEPYDPAENVAGGVRYLQWLTDQWQDSIPDDDQRLRFILASYNAGAGHVGDARRLTRKYGGDPNRWEDVAYWLLQKSKARYYRDPVVRYGFARGMEPVLYVSRILDRFEHYQEFVLPDGPTAEDEAVAADRSGAPTTPVARLR
ncbi:MAG: transglycosylase SLT domain-containing protein [Gemmatimonadota bacterium]